MSNIVFPTTLDALSNPASTDLVANANPLLGHARQHDDANDAIEALEAKVGVDSSAVATSLDYKLAALTSIVNILNQPGMMFPYSGSAAPSGYLLCDGTSYLQANYAALFAVIGTTYGSVDGTHFNVPDLRGRVPVGVGTGTGGGAAGTGLPAGGSALTAVARAGWKGEETHVLTVPELAAHTHTATQVSTNGVSMTNNGFPNFNGTTSGSTGGDTAHNNIQPVMGVNYLIKT